MNTTERDIMKEQSKNEQQEGATGSHPGQAEYDQQGDRHAGHGEKHQGDHHGNHADHGSHHEHMVQDFKRRFFVSLILTVPLAVMSPMLRSLLGFDDATFFQGHMLVMLALATAIFFYGGWPFLKGLVDELKEGAPGMMTLIALAITVAYGYSGLVAIGVKGKVFFWELASLIDIMLLGHWIEMRSVMAASGAMEKLARLVPGQAHRLEEDGSTEERCGRRPEEGGYGSG